MTFETGPKKFIIEERICFDSHLLSLSQEHLKTELTCNESELLLMLLSGTATKGAVMKAVWERKGVVVTDSSYHQLVRALRQRLEAHGVSGTLIKTLPRQGLRFIGSIREIETITGPSIPHTFSPDQAPGSFEASSVPQVDQNVRPEAPSKGDRIRTKEVLLLFGFALWAGFLMWQSLTGGNPTPFPHQITVENIRYFSTSPTPEAPLNEKFGIAVAPGNTVYEMPRNKNRWLAICPDSLYRHPELCTTFLVKQSSSQ